MVKKKELHTLICSLTRSEKRYFKLFCKRESSGANYLKLFDAIDEQEEYDESFIKEQFKDETFVRQLHVTKYYLRKAIMKSLRNFHAGISKNAELKTLLRNVEILFNKELYGLCVAELKKAEKMAREYELLAGLTEVQDWKRKLNQVLEPYDYDLRQKALQEKDNTIDLLRNTNQYRQLASLISQSVLSGKKPENARSILKNLGRASTLEAKVMYYNAKYMKYLHDGEDDEAERALRTLLELLEANDHRIEEEPGLYVGGLNNLVSFLVFNNQYSEALEYIQQAKDLYERWEVKSGNRTLLKQMLRTLNIEMEIYRDSKLLDESDGFIESTETLVKNYENKMPREYLLSFWFQFASIHFMGGNFSRALQWVNRLVNTRHKEYRKDLQLQGRMLNLMIHLEQKNLMVLRHYVDSTRRYMKKVKDVQPFEKVLLRFFIKIGRLPLLEYRDAFQELKEQLFPENEASLLPENVLGYIDYRQWIDGKIK